MCNLTKCKKCGKSTWDGCGAHIESIKRQVPPEDWCECPRSIPQMTRSQAEKIRREKLAERKKRDMKIKEEQSKDITAISKL